MMNLKPNLWTVLFLIAAAALGYQYTQEETEEETTPDVSGLTTGAGEETEGEEYKTLSLPVNNLTANTQRSNYVTYSNALKNLLQQVHVDIMGITNPDVQHFKLDPASLRSIMRVYEGEEVYAVLVTKEEGGKNVIDLVFSDKSPRSEEFATTAKIYDFSTPCPTLCDE